jgi:hypothetical protein
MNQAFYIGRKIIINLDARIVGTFLKFISLKRGRWRLVLFLVLIVWISKLCSNMSLLLITNSNIESMYCDCSGKICNFLNCPLQEFLLLQFVIILISFFCSLDILFVIESPRILYHKILRNDNLLSCQTGKIIYLFTFHKSWYRYGISHVNISHSTNKQTNHMNIE